MTILLRALQIHPERDRGVSPPGSRRVGERVVEGIDGIWAVHPELEQRGGDLNARALTRPGPRVTVERRRPGDKMAEEDRLFRVLITQPAARFGALDHPGARDHSRPASRCDVLQ
jgi:hypothetical protein